MKSSPPPNDGERKSKEFNLMFNYTVVEEVRSLTLLSKEYKTREKNTGYASNIKY
jgi:hypothetical protein